MEPPANHAGVAEEVELPDALPPEQFREWCRHRICPKARVSTARENEANWLGMFVTGCRRWDCETCGPKKRALLIARILKAQPQRFLTLTVQAPTPENGITWTPRDAFDRTRRAASELFKSMNRGRKKTEYCRVLEQTARGYPHYHYLTRGPFWPIDEVRDTWKRLTGSFVVDIRRPERAESSTKYVAKYLTKSAAVTFTERRFSASRKFWAPCELCDQVKCVCARSSWFDFWVHEDARHHWSYHVEKMAQYHAIIRGASPGQYWLLDRTPGDAMPADLEHERIPEEERRQHQSNT